MRDWFDSPRVARLAHGCAWFVCFAVATCVAKYAALAHLYARNVGSVLAEIDAVHAPMATAAIVLARDVQECAVVALIVSVAFFWLPARALYRCAAVLYLLLLAANHVSFLELGAFMSFDVLKTTWGWVQQRPEVMTAHVSFPTLAVAPLAAFWVLLPELLLRGRAFRLAAVTVAIALVCVSAPLRAVGNARFGVNAFPPQGYWSRFAQTNQGATNPTGLVAPSEDILRNDFLALSRTPSAPTGPLMLRSQPRHVLVVGLETAPRAFYPLTSSADLPTFALMTKQSIVSERHYTTSPYTRMANFSILSGVYPPPSGLPIRYGPIATDGLASVLRARGYETTYVDSWVLDWLPDSHEREQAEALGFERVLDSEVRRDDGVFEVLVAGETAAFDQAFSRITQAQAHGTKALVFVGTMLGHAPWPAAVGDESLDGPARIAKIARVFDGLFATLLKRLEDAGLGEDVLIVVVGDHGLRLTDEFTSLGRTYEHSDLAFNVPFLLYAPGLVPSTTRVAHATSHVDITPTLLHLLGANTDGLLLDGHYMLDPRLDERVVFLSNSKLGPSDGMVWKNHYLTFHSLTGVSVLRTGGDLGSLPGFLQDPAALLQRFELHTNLVAASLLARAKRR